MMHEEVFYEVINNNHTETLNSTDDELMNHLWGLLDFS